MKRRSITRPPDLTLFTDEDTGLKRHHKLPSILIDSGLQVECLGDHLDRQTPDHEWLPFCGERGWIGVTKDKKIRLDERSMLAIARAEVQTVTLIGSWTHDELATNLVNSIYVLERHLRSQEPPCMLKLHMAAPQKRDKGRAGRVEVYRDRPAILAEIGHLLR